jgi:hypothetical protein
MYSLLGYGLQLWGLSVMFLCLMTLALSCTGSLYVTSLQNSGKTPFPTVPLLLCAWSLPWKRVLTSNFVAMDAAMMLL